MPSAVMGGSVVAVSAMLRLAAAGAGKPGGANPEAAVPPCYCVVMMSAAGAFVVAAYGLEAGGACSPAVVVVVGGIWDVTAVVVPTCSVMMTCCSDTAYVALG